MTRNQKIAVVGASGVVGRALIERLMATGQKVIGLSRRAPADLPCPFVSLDLNNRDTTLAVTKSELADVTHLVYTALYEKPGLIGGWRESDQMQTNLQMLTNLLDPLLRLGNLRHVTLLQGTKAYGAHIAPMKIPGLERDPRHDHQNFYWLQEDYLRSAQQEHNFEFTIWRPQIVFGHALHAPMNLLAAIGVYITIQKDKGLPLAYPGGMSAVAEATDADLLASAIAFSFDDPAFTNETFNITNGDVFRWQDIWPSIAGTFGVSDGQPVKTTFISLYDEEARWKRIVDRHGLQPLSIREIAGDSLYYADALFNVRDMPHPPPAIVSTIKLRQAGFEECIDTEVMFGKWFERLIKLRIIPA